MNNEDKTRDALREWLKGPGTASNNLEERTMNELIKLRAEERSARQGMNRRNMKVIAVYCILTVVIFGWSLGDKIPELPASRDLLPASYFPYYLAIVVTGALSAISLAVYFFQGSKKLAGT